VAATRARTRAPILVPIRARTPVLIRARTPVLIRGRTPVPTPVPTPVQTLARTPVPALVLIRARTPVPTQATRLLALAVRERYVRATVRRQPENPELYQPEPPPRPPGRAAPTPVGGSRGR